MPFSCEGIQYKNNIINDTNTLKKENLEAENGIPPYDRISHSLMSPAGQALR